jgi:hypothetical protein
MFWENDLVEQAIYHKATYWDEVLPLNELLSPGSSHFSFWQVVIIVLSCNVYKNIFLHAGFITNSNNINKVVNNSHWESNRVKEDSPSPLVRIMSCILFGWMALSVLVTLFFSKFYEQEEECNRRQEQRMETVKVESLRYLNEEENAEGDREGDEA